MSQTVIHLSPRFFSERETVLLESTPFSASAFLYPSGVCGLRLKNDLGQLVMLPFQGQQIWSAEFEGRDLTMKSMFPEPRPTREYLATYGAFLVHCGATAMGVPTAQDNHPLHGELPNAPYQAAYLVLGQDEEGAYIGLGGRYQHTIAFTHNYVAEPLVKLYAGSTLLSVTMTITNLKHTPMELMYMAHVNFRLVDNGRLVYSAPCTPERVRVRTGIPPHIPTPPGYRELLEEIARHPERHHILSPDLPIETELVFTIDYLADEEGWAHSMQVHPDGRADYVAHRPAQLDKGVRWMVRNADQAALGIVLPATAGPEGYTTEKARGNIKVIPALGLCPSGTTIENIASSERAKWQAEVRMGALTPAQAAEMERKIERILATSRR